MIKKSLCVKKNNVLLGVTGSIAAYKAADIASILRKLDVNMQVVMTKSSESFITSTTLGAVSGALVLCESSVGGSMEPQSQYDTQESEDKCDAIKNKERNIDHINMARFADIILIAPASANFIAKLVYGIADDNLSAICLASNASILIAPAMNKHMWSSKANQENISKLKSRGVKIIGPSHGIQACGDLGIGKMSTPQEIVNYLQDYISKLELLHSKLVGKKILITAGPTQEDIDPVRYISNRSSGKMGYAIAEAALHAGAKVLLVSGPTHIEIPTGVECIKVKSADEMYKKVEENMPEYDAFISCAAVGDYKVVAISNSKIKKKQCDESQKMHLELSQNKDILLNMSSLFPDKKMIGFAAETENLEENAIKKLKKKKLDMIVANYVGPKRKEEPIGFESDNNEVTIIKKSQDKITIPRDTKSNIAVKITEHISGLFSHL